MIKCAANEGGGGMAEMAIQCGRHVIRCFAGCCNAIMTGLAIVHDASVIESRSGKGAGGMTHTAILGGGNVAVWFASGKYAIMARLAVIHDSRMVKRCG